MRVTLLLLIGLFLQTSIFAQNDTSPKGNEDAQKELQNQLNDLGSLFGGGEIKIDSLLQNFDLGSLNLGNLDLENLNIEELNIEDLMQLGGGGGTMPGGMDMQSMMDLMQQSMQGMDLGNIEELLGPLMGDLDKMMPQQPQQEEELKGEDGQPIKKKKKSTKKTYKL